MSDDYCDFCFSAEEYLGECDNCGVEVCYDCGELNAYDESVHFDCDEDIE